MVRITLDKPYIPIPVPVTAIKYGLLYNWYAATDARGITSDSIFTWNVPSHDDFTDLINYLGGNSEAGGILKESGYVFWDEPNTGATNEVGFNAKGSGIRLFSTGEFYNLNYNITLLTRITAAIINPDSCYVNQIEADSASFYLNGGINKKIGASIRLVKTPTSLSHGQTGIYTGNDGKVYRTICIGTQEWLADNLAETKYRNGDTIPEVTNNAAWAALTTGALCAYNNDWSNVLI